MTIAVCSALICAAAWGEDFLAIWRDAGEEA